MARLVYLDSARQDLIEILRYIAKTSGSVAVGQHFTGLLRQKCRHLAALPGDMGRLRPELGPDIRSSAFRGYVIFFRLRDGLFEVINILEGHRDVERHFESPPPDTPDP
ncbi:plasmid stabilization system protein ParE [Neorhizobium galegae]|uniref:type II toxin-antitoxin system RelE/ParE family toxin n=1 Tax=Neorhizobium galegae TaxID=399 RepID=UPI001AEAC3E6|nr:plasmid stabilization system protein ParE [Neorhizobium galegae]